MIYKKIVCFKIIKLIYEIPIYKYFIIKIIKSFGKHYLF